MSKYEHKYDFFVFFLRLLTYIELLIGVQIEQNTHTEYVVNVV